MIELARTALARARLGDVEDRPLVLWGLQYDLRPDDHDLVRTLAAAEAEDRADDDFQGHTEESELVGFLLASYRDVTDVWLHWDLKRANFDTWSGYDVEYVVAAGVAETLEFVRASDHPERDAVLERLADVGEVDLARWWRRKQSWFPADPADENPLTWSDRAARLGRHADARTWLDLWSQGRDRNEETLTVLRGRYADLGAHAEAAAAQRDLLAFARDAWGTASALKTLARHERLAGRHDAAWSALWDCAAALADVPEWREFGLGRHYAEELFALARDASGDLARTAFETADRADVPGLALVTLRIAADAAAKVGLREEHYRTARDAEAHRVEV
ncbi:hypothetical protein [Saccharothrix variisporea]|uniref:hypothetical protein n=1 Tax=Saccharothrix variisporea TaxID=543527 RepID=UPI001B868338|nr:hypothetical protein [Saccharothrix variisporea]